MLKMLNMAVTLMHCLPPFACCFLCLVAATLVQGSIENERKPYIVYMGEVPHQGDRISVMEEHHNLLLKTIGDEKTAIESKIYSYGKSINAFAARLLPDEARRLADEDGVVSVFENTRRKLLTTRSWDFLGMPKSLKNRNPIVESNIIVALLDTGIWAGHPSFSDEGYGPPPAKWKGKCDKGANFTGCNNKVIGARYYQLDKSHPIMDDPTPVDNDGHGTHTASTAAGIAVKGASLFDIAKGTARGGVPSARIAMYKVCWSLGCTEIDILAAFDDAIHDGVDMISVSIGGVSLSLFKDAIAIGAFHAMRKGILTTCAGGNAGPWMSTVENVAPWILTVGANSIDRDFTSIIKLGDGTTTSGNGINIFTMKNKMYPFTNGAHAANLNGSNHGNVSACDDGTLSKDKVKGKIVYCLGDQLQDYTIKKLGGAGTVMAADGEPSDAYFLTYTPATTVVRNKVGDKLDRYINKTKNPRAVIYKSKTVPMAAPFVASFSARGPQLLSPNILKPDVTAPGLNILAAYPEKIPVTEDTDLRYSSFNFMSGTSMAYPHASAAAAYVKSFHPDWSPAAIKSALMTTATPMKIKDNNEELSTGSGQINPTKAINPGLIYDIDQNSYISYLCKQGFNSTTIGIIIGGKGKFNCSSFKPARGTDGLNYPSMHIYLNSTKSSILAVFYRTVTNVAPENSQYKAKVTSPKGLFVTVFPKTLKFNKIRQKQSFKVFLKGGPMKKGTGILSTTLEWSNESHSVKSPIVVFNRQTFF